MHHAWNRVQAELAKRRKKLGVLLWTREGRILPDGLELEAVDPVLPVIEVLDQQIKEISWGLKRMCGKDPRVRLLTTLQGVGYYLALLLGSEIGDVNRVPDSEKLCNYAGLVSQVRRSGGSTHHGEATGAPELIWVQGPRIRYLLRMKSLGYL